MSQYKDLKLEKGMYNEAGRSFTQVLEREDPSEQYKGTALEGLDAYQRHDESGTPTGSYLLCYENRFVEIRFDGWDNAAPTAEQMALVGEALGFGALT